MDLRETGWSGMDWIDLEQDKDRLKDLVNTVINFRVPQNVGKFLSSCAIGGFSRSQLRKLVLFVMKMTPYLYNVTPVSNRIRIRIGFNSVISRSYSILFLSVVQRLTLSLRGSRIKSCYSDGWIMNWFGLES
jgi:hypothetical protein